MKTVRDRRASRWDAHRQTRRVELTDAAIRAIRTHGAGVGMDEVATTAGTSKTVVYRHFGDRTELYVAVCARVAGVLVGQVKAAMDGATGPHAQTAAGIEAYLRLIEHDPEVYRFVVHRPLVDRAEVNARARKRPAAADSDPVMDLTALVGDQAAAVIAARTGDPAAAVPWGHGIVGMVRAAADNWLARPTGMSRAQLAAHLTELAWAGLSGVAPHKEES